MNPYVPPTTPVEAPQGPTAWDRALAGWAIAGMHSSSCFLPISLYEPRWVASMLYLHKVPGLATQPLLLQWMWLFWLIVNILSFSALLFLLRARNLRESWFYVCSMGIIITLAFCTLAGAIWNVAFIIAIAVLFGRRTREFFPGWKPRERTPNPRFDRMRDRLEKGLFS